MKRLIAALCIASAASAGAQDSSFVLRPARVWDGTSDRARSGDFVVVTGRRIAAVGPASSIRVPPGARVIDLPGATLIPGLIDAHSHVLLHPYNETSWDDQVLRESQSLRVARAVNHLRATVQAGFTTLRDLGTEGAGYADLGAGHHRGTAAPDFVARDRGSRQLRSTRIRLGVERTAGRRGGRRRGKSRADRSRSDWPRGRLDQDLRGLPLEA
jgi:cytosine/adenosine deaminase-related metal-dependent hydrolase